jgi:hypothetical protein
MARRVKASEPTGGRPAASDASAVVRPVEMPAAPLSRMGPVAPDPGSSAAARGVAGVASGPIPAGPPTTALSGHPRLPSTPPVGPPPAWPSTPWPPDPGPVGPPCSPAGEPEPGSAGDIPPAGPSPGSRPPSGHGAPVAPWMLNGPPTPADCPGPPLEPPDGAGPGRPPWPPVPAGAGVSPATSGAALGAWVGCPGNVGVGVARGVRDGAGEPPGIVDEPGRGLGVAVGCGLLLGA